MLPKIRYSCKECSWIGDADELDGEYESIYDEDGSYKGTERVSDYCPECGSAVTEFIVRPENTL